PLASLPGSGSKPLQLFGLRKTPELSLALIQAPSPLGATGSVPATGGSWKTARSHILTNFSDTRAQGRPGARCTRGPMRNVHRKCAHEHTGQRRTSDIPCAMALRLITCSPRRTALLHSERHARLLSLGVLRPAPRRQDHTSLPYASAPIVIGTSASTASPPLVVTM